MGGGHKFIGNLYWRYLLKIGNDIFYSVFFYKIHLLDSELNVQNFVSRPRREVVQNQGSGLSSLTFSFPWFQAVQYENHTILYWKDKLPTQALRPRLLNCCRQVQTYRQGGTESFHSCTFGIDVYEPSGTAERISKWGAENERRRPEFVGASPPRKFWKARKSCLQHSPRDTSWNN